MAVESTMYLCAVVGRKRRGAVNARQLAYLARYRPKSRLKMKQTCTIMWRSLNGHQYGHVHAVIYFDNNEQKTLSMGWRPLRLPRLLLCSHLAKFDLINNDCFYAWIGTFVMVMCVSTSECHYRRLILRVPTTLGKSLKGVHFFGQFSKSWRFVP